MAEKTYRQWRPLEDLPPILYLDALYDDYEGFRMLLRGEDPTIRMLRIAADPLSYRNSHEGDLLRSMPKICEPEWPLLTVEHSEYLSWFHAESLEIHRKDNPVHYLIVTPADCVDVLATAPPKVEWL